MALVEPSLTALYGVALSGPLTDRAPVQAMRHVTFLSGYAPGQLRAAQDLTT
jgi:hypothetical protein